MREIKFRAWDKDFEKFVTTPLKYAIEDINHYTDYEWMQHTGLKDTNSTEIYEGDILGCFDGDTWCAMGVVKYNDKAECILCGKYSLVDRDGYANDWTYEEAAEPQYWHFLMVIGNIYDNPELMEDEKQ